MYRFVRITNYYPQYLKSYYATNGDILKRSYREQYEHLVTNSLESASSYSKELNKLNGVFAADIISNAQLQATSKAENNLSVDMTNADLVIEQLKSLQPDVVWVDDFSIIDAEWKIKLLESVKSVKLLAGHICAPYNSTIEEKLRLFDVVFSCIPCMVEELKGKGINAYLLYHSFDSNILPLMNKDNDQPQTELLFSGSLYAGAGFHNTRMEYIEAFLKAGIPVSLYCNLESFRKIFLKKMFYHLVKSIQAVGMKSLIDKVSFLKTKKSYGEVPVSFYSKKLVKASHPPVFGINLFRLMSKAKITFNNHGEVAGKCAGNIRMFEVTGAGSCLVTDWKENINELFEPGKEIITYVSIEDCIEKVNWLLKNPAEREKIARAGHERTMRDHTVSGRVKILNEIFEKELHKKENRKIN